MNEIKNGIETTTTKGEIMAYYELLFDMMLNVTEICFQRVSEPDTIEGYSDEFLNLVSGATFISVRFWSQAEFHASHT